MDFVPRIIDFILKMSDLLAKNGGYRSTYATRTAMNSRRSFRISIAIMINVLICWSLFHTFLVRLRQARYQWALKQRRIVYHWSMLCCARCLMTLIMIIMVRGF